MTYQEKAIHYFTSGYNCCQAVLLAFHQELNLDKELALRLASSMGGGMGGMREVCGAVSGMFLVAGMKQGYTKPHDPPTKKAHYQLIQQMAEEFKKETGSIICRDLLGQEEASKAPAQERTEAYYKKRPCAELCGLAAKIAAKYLGFE